MQAGQNKPFLDEEMAWLLLACEHRHETCAQVSVGNGVQRVMGGARESKARCVAERGAAAMMGINIPSVCIAQKSACCAVPRAEPMAANARHWSHCSSTGSRLSFEVPDVCSAERCETACVIPNCCEKSSSSTRMIWVAERGSFTIHKWKAREIIVHLAMTQHDKD